ncbi:EAL domain-containing protein [Acuticoccus mangrovi]|uniref:cyclic-guanylate-specific phosphodiesterase n=1 Tax=Acuticoccus mangrovi TaxID=2796142 RepID=A0A934MFE2_9HYPH|nr:EAL domain-containing protein [Acuticoccus mangrovi]MBJ3778572.1 EAL domain-containing protein [Acuticoccus mangrovi]
MKRHHIIQLTVVLSIAGAVIPLAITALLAWNLAVRHKEDELAVLAARVLERAEIAMAQAEGALSAMAQRTADPCSADNIEEMRRLTIRSRAIEEIGYIEEGVLACTSWGSTGSEYGTVASDFRISNDMSVSIRVEPNDALGTPMMALRLQRYYALIDPGHFTDVLAAPTIRVALAHNEGGVLATNNAPGPDLLALLTSDRTTAPQPPDVYAVLTRGAFTALAAAPRSDVSSTLRREFLLLLPPAAVIVTVIILAVIATSRRRLSPTGEIASGLHRREFFVRYQPIIRLEDEVCLGAEALVRWRRRDGTEVPADQFVPIAERSGQIRELTDQVIDRVLVDMADTLAKRPDIHVAINFSADDMDSGRIITKLENALKGTGIQPQQIWLEATERSLMHVDRARATIIAAHERGHSVAIDDFGTGYSSLQYLQQLPVDAIKIDKTFVDTIGTDAATSIVIPHIIEMAKTLNLVMVAEGIENAEQLAYLRAAGVQGGQGYLFARPLDPGDFVAYLNRPRGAVAPEATQPETSFLSIGP